MPATWKVYVDWNDDGDYADSGEDITSRVLDGHAPVTMTYGRDQARALSPPRVGEAALTLNNASGDYYPDKVSSPRYGQVMPARKTKIEATLLSTTYGTFSGVTDDFEIRPGTDEGTVSVTLVDGMSALRGLKISTPMYTGLRTGEALHKILDAIGWPSTDRDIDAGATVMPYWWVDDTDAYEAALELLDSEGPYSLITCDSQRRIIYRDRHHRSIRSKSTTVQATWYSKTTEPMFSSPMPYDHGWKDIINVLSFEVPMRVTSPDLVVVWSAPSRITIASGETLAVTVKGSSPFFGAVIPVADVDYTATGTVTVDMPKDSGESTTVYLTAPSGVAYVDGLQVRGFSVTEAGSLVVNAEDASTARYGRRSSANLRPPKWAGYYDTQAIALLILTQRSERLPTMSITMKAGNDTRQLQQLTRDLSDRVRVIAYDMGMDAECWVEQITHAVTQGGQEHTTTFGVEKAPTQVVGAFVLGTSLLGTGKLGRRGFTDPDKIFILGSATNGVLGTDILAA